ncbi:MAG: LysM peptidoglycan-binding domain-containing protein [Deltaproteobacteria bacterium]|nr:LysM peptidoglycan-binding domain-containing protein [Deltaproteobacteria bacterium]
MTVKKLIAISFSLVLIGSCLAIAGKSVPKTYIIKKGDTLWGVSERFLKDPQYWPNLWSYNEFVTNPHLIFPGQKITIYDGRTLVVGEQKTAPGQGTWEQTIDSDVITVKTMGEPEGFITSDELDASGVLVDATDNRILLTKDDTVFLQMKDLSSVNVGDKYSVFRKGKEVKHPRTGKQMGHQIVDVGEVTILELNESVATAQITDASQEIRRGDAIVPLSTKVQEIVMKKSSESLSGFVVSATSDQLALGAYDLLYLDLGSKDGLYPGNLVYLARERKVTAQALTKEDLQLPDVLLGSAVVLETGPHTSSALILKSREDIQVGDKAFTVKH